MASGTHSLRILTGTEPGQVVGARLPKTRLKRMAKPMEEKITRKVFDVATKSDVTLQKVFQFEPPKDQAEVLARIGGDSAKYLELLTEGLRQHERDTASSNDAIAWTDVDGKPFAGDLLTEEQSSRLDALVLTFAKTSFGYESKNAAAKTKAKADALAFILDNDQIFAKIRE